MRPGRRRPLTVGGMLEGIKTALGSNAKFTWVPANFLEEQKVEPWSDMPVWVPPIGEDGGMGAVSIKRALDKGLTFRPLAETARDTLAWFKAQPKERQEKLKAGITAEREAEVLAAWHKQKEDSATVRQVPRVIHRFGTACGRHGRPYTSCFPAFLIHSLVSLADFHSGTSATGTKTLMNRALTLLQKAVDVRPNELRALLVACVFNFVILGSYYVIRPIRDDIAAAGSLESLSWMFTGTLVAMLIANTLFSAIVSRMSRRKFLPIAYRFFSLNLIIFYLLMRTLTPAQNVWVGRAFYVWVSVFNLFVVTLFWAFMTDVFSSEQAKRLFAFIAVGGSLGAIAGPIVTASLVQKLGAANLILVTAALLELGPWCVKYFPAEFQTGPLAPTPANAKPTKS